MGPGAGWQLCRARTGSPHRGSPFASCGLRRGSPEPPLPPEWSDCLDQVVNGLEFGLASFVATLVRRIEVRVIFPLQSSGHGLLLQVAGDAARNFMGLSRLTVPPDSCEHRIGRGV